jgi:hypothetical protein
MLILKLEVFHHSVKVVMGDMLEGELR